MLNYRLGTVNENDWGFKPVFRCSKPHTFSTFSGEEKEKTKQFTKPKIVDDDRSLKPATRHSKDVV